jgi:hypothetical protein
MSAEKYLRPANSHEISVGKALSCLWHNSLSQSQVDQGRQAAVNISPFQSYVEGF